MSITTVAVPASRQYVTRTRLRLTRRGRRVFAALAAAPVVAAVAIAVINGGAALGADDQSGPAGTPSAVTVMPGDSLWSIAERVAPQDDPRDVVDALSELNGLSSSSVDAGQRLFLPIAYSSGR